MPASEGLATGSREKPPRGLRRKIPTALYSLNAVEESSAAAISAAASDVAPRPETRSSAGSRLRLAVPRRDPPPGGYSSRPCAPSPRA